MSPLHDTALLEILWVQLCSPDNFLPIPYVFLLHFFLILGTRNLVCLHAYKGRKFGRSSPGGRAAASISKNPLYPIVHVSNMRLFRQMKSHKNSYYWLQEKLMQTNDMFLRFLKKALIIVKSQKQGKSHLVPVAPPCTSHPSHTLQSDSYITLPFWLHQSIGPD